jgi:hypothetical protein
VTAGTEVAQRRQLGRSVLAIGVAFIAVFALSLGTDVLLHATGVYPPWGQSMSDGLFGLATAYRLTYGTFGSWMTARLAPSRPMAHSLVGAAIGTVLATVGAVVTWNKGPEFGPHWYPLALVVTAIPCGWLGAVIATRRPG